MESQENPWIFADFNNADSEGRLRLNCKGTHEDLARLQLEFVEGSRYIFFDGELRVEGRVFKSCEGLWVAEIAWDEIEEVDTDA